MKREKNRKTLLWIIDHVDSWLIDSWLVRLMNKLISMRHHGVEAAFLLLASCVSNPSQNLIYTWTERRLTQHLPPPPPPPSQSPLCSITSRQSRVYVDISSTRISKSWQLWFATCICNLVSRVLLSRGAPQVNGPWVRGCLYLLQNDLEMTYCHAILSVPYNFTD